MFRWLRPCSMLLLLVLLCGCLPIAEGPQDEAKNPYIVTGSERMKARDYKGAIEAYQKALEVNPRSVTAHFELGVIYEQFENDYPAAIYHYNQVIKLRPDGAYPADNARQRIPGCKQEMLKADTLATINPAALRETTRLREENVQLKKQIDFLQAQLANVQAQLNAANAQIARAPAIRPPANAYPATPSLARASDVVSQSSGSDFRQASPSPSRNRAAGASPPGARPGTHLVRPRETFASIARRYGITLQALMRANPAVEPKRLKAGQVIRLPSAN